MAICDPGLESTRLPVAGGVRGLLRVCGGWIGQSLSLLCQLIWLSGYLGAAALLLPSLVSLAHWTSEREHYEHFPLLIVAAAFLAVVRIYSAPTPLIARVSSRVLFWTLLAFGLTIAVHVLPSRWLAGVAAWCLIAATVAFLGGRALSQRMVGPLLLLAAAIPLPVNLDSWLIVEMQHLATRLASLWLDLAGVLHFTSGVAIQTPGQDFFVEDACSGIHSLFAAIAVGVGYGVFREYRLPRVAALVLQMIFWVLVANALRVFLTVYAQTGMDLESWNLKSVGLGTLGLEDDAQHAGLGMLTFAAGIGLAFCGDAFLRYVVPIGGESLRDSRCEWLRAERASRGIDRSLPAWGLVIPGMAAIGCAVAVSGPPAAGVAMAEKDGFRFPVSGFREETVGGGGPFAGLVGPLTPTLSPKVNRGGVGGEGGAEGAIPFGGEGAGKGRAGVGAEEGPGVKEGGAVTRGGKVALPQVDRGFLEGELEQPSPGLRARPSRGEGDGLNALVSRGEGDGLLPEALAGWRKVGYRVQERAADDPFGGLVSHIWRYEKGNRSVVVSLDGPYSEWHNLAICYSALGWEIDEASDVLISLDGDVGDLEGERGKAGGEWVARQLQLTRVPLDRAHVIFACVDPAGRCVSPHLHTGAPWMRLAERLRAAMQERPSHEGKLMQVQVLEEIVGERTEEAAEEIRRVFEEAVREVAGVR